jgi:hypothetical protein
LAFSQMKGVLLLVFDDAISLVELQLKNRREADIDKIFFFIFRIRF